MKSNHQLRYLFFRKTPGDNISLQRYGTAIFCLLITLICYPFASLFPSSSSLPDTLIIRDTILREKLIGGASEIYTQLTIIGKAKIDGTITLEFYPLFIEKKKVLKYDQIKNYTLDYILNPTQIVIEPDKLYKLSDKDKRPVSLLIPDKNKKPVSEKVILLTFEPLNEIITDSVTFLIPLTLYYSDGKKKSLPSFTIHFNTKNNPITEALNNTKEDNAPPDAPIINNQEPRKADTSGNNTKHELPQASNTQSQEQNAGGHGNEAPSGSSISDLTFHIEQIKLIHSQLHDMMMNIESVPVNQSILQQRKMDIDNNKLNFDFKYKSVTFSNSESSERIYNMFNDYYYKADKLIQVLSKAGVSVNTNHPNTNVTNNSNGTVKSEKLILYLIIFIAIIVMLFVVVIIIMKLQKNKKAINLQKSLQRKAQMELNKQKFQATQKKDRIKI